MQRKSETMISRAMTENSIFASAALPYRPRFVVVNNRVPRSGEHCALCGDVVMGGYVRDLQTRSVYCDSRCFAGGARIAMSGKNFERKVS
jgi:hypothetical protein